LTPLGLKGLIHTDFNVVFQKFSGAMPSDPIATASFPRPHPPTTSLRNSELRLWSPRWHFWNVKDIEIITYTFVVVDILCSVVFPVVIIVTQFKYRS